MSDACIINKKKKEKEMFYSLQQQLLLIQEPPPGKGTLKQNLLHALLSGQCPSVLEQINRDSPSLFSFFSIDEHTTKPIHINPNKTMLIFTSIIFKPILLLSSLFFFFSTFQNKEQSWISYHRFFTLFKHQILLFTFSFRSFNNST